MIILQCSSMERAVRECLAVLRMYKTYATQFVAEEYLFQVVIRLPFGPCRG